MALQFSWLTFGSAKTQLAARLADPSKLFWTDAELGIYIIEALRTWNALTETWNADFVFQATAANTWYDFGSLANSPRFRTVTDTSLYTTMQYHLLEQPSGGGTWTGTPQFSLSDLQNALQRRCDEVIQVAGCKLAKTTIDIVVDLNSVRFFVPDNVLEPRRVRYLPTVPGVNVTLTREDTASFDYFEAEHLQSPGTPSAWSVTAQPPLAIDTDVPPNLPGKFDILALLAGAQFAPPASTLIGIPDDWSWLPKWGALADLLGRESEATDLPRAQYCLKRYMDGLKMIQDSNWIIGGQINGVPYDTVSLAEMDSYSPEWEGDASAWPGIVVAGTDFIAPCPVATGATQIGVRTTTVGNIPVPSADDQSLQISRDSWDAVLSYAQSLAMFKQGGAEAKAAQQLDAEFFAQVQLNNKRISKLGLIFDTMHTQGKREDQNQERW